MASNRSGTLERFGTFSTDLNNMLTQEIDVIRKINKGDLYARWRYGGSTGR
jgi:hypothetical protein